jgi:hypothetical protein
MKTEQEIKEFYRLKKVIEDYHSTKDDTTPKRTVNNKQTVDDWLQ